MEYKKMGETYYVRMDRDNIGRKFDPETGTGFWDFK